MRTRFVGACEADDFIIGNVNVVDADFGGEDTDSPEGETAEVIDLEAHRTSETKKVARAA